MKTTKTITTLTCIFFISICYSQKTLNKTITKNKQQTTYYIKKAYTINSQSNVLLSESPIYPDKVIFTNEKITLVNYDKKKWVYYIKTRPQIEKQNLDNDILTKKTFYVGYIDTPIDEYIEMKFMNHSNPNIEPNTSLIIYIDNIKDDNIDTYLLFELKK